MAIYRVSQKITPYGWTTISLTILSGPWCRVVQISGLLGQ